MEDNTNNQVPQNTGGQQPQNTQIPPVKQSQTGQIDPYSQDDVKKAKDTAPDPSKILGDDQSFFQDPFIDPNSTAFDEKKKEILGLNIPPHSTVFDEKEFQHLIAESISLTFNEKKQIIASIPRLTQYQIDELLKILRDEKVKFEELNKKHLEKLKEFENGKAAHSETIEHKAERLLREQQDKVEADEILKSLQDL